MILSLEFEFRVRWFGMKSTSYSRLDTALAVLMGHAKAAGHTVGAIAGQACSLELNVRFSSLSDDVQAFCGVIRVPYGRVNALAETTGCMREGQLVSANPTASQVLAAFLTHGVLVNPWCGTINPTAKGLSEVELDELFAEDET